MSAVSDRPRRLGCGGRRRRDQRECQGDGGARRRAIELLHSRNLQSCRKGQEIAAQISVIRPDHVKPAVRGTPLKSTTFTVVPANR